MNMENKLLSENIGIIIVMYNPSMKEIDNVKNIALYYKGVIVDNSPYRNFIKDKIGYMTYYPLENNTGIAFAQNIGIKRLISTNGITHILFLDQDSKIDIDFPLKMQKEHGRIKSNNKKLAFLGPRVIDDYTKEEYKSPIHKNATIKEGFTQRREIISSGSIIELVTLQSIGLTLPTLFIDFVDFELCWRAKHKGYTCGITQNIQMNHQVGSKSITIGSYKILVWTPFRYYFQARNFIWLITVNYVPIKWKLATGIKFIARIVYLPYMHNRKGLDCWKQLIKGFICSRHGFRKFKSEVNSYDK